MTNDPHRVPRAQARRELALLLAVVAVVVLAVFTLGFWIGMLEKLDPLGAGAILIIGAVALVRFRRHRGVGWAVARGAAIGLAITLVVVAGFFGACVATQCVG